MSNDKKQTAVEWLIQELGEYFPHEKDGVHVVVELANEMFELQTKHAYDWGETNASDECNGDGPTHDNFEQYYNETYKQQ
jgi:hypothetical protein